MGKEKFNAEKKRKKSVRFFFQPGRGVLTFL